MFNRNWKSLCIDAQLEAVRTHFDDHRVAMMNASGLIGGELARRRVLRLVTELREANRLTRHAKAELLALHRLLTFDPLGLEPEVWDDCLMLDPGSREVEEICLLADRLRDLLEALARMEDDRAADAQAVPLTGAASPTQRRRPSGRRLEGRAPPLARTGERSHETSFNSTRHLCRSSACGEGSRRRSCVATRALA